VTRRGFSSLLTDDREAVGTWTQIAAPDLIDMLGDAGFDFTIIDCEHGAFGIETAENLFRACDAAGIVSLCRAPGLDAAWIGRALDSGAAAVVVPGIDSAEAARRAVAATRFAPHGTRGACPCVRAGGHFIGDWKGHVDAEQQKGVIALVETMAGLDAVESIAATPGMLALMAGPFDLAVSMGLSGNWQDARIEAAMDRIAAAARAHALPLIAPVFDADPDVAAHRRAAWAARGARIFTVGTDKILFAVTARRYRAAMA
jgi:4-hydroxy-2-oxoheptanedioate aldolase